MNLAQADQTRKLILRGDFSADNFVPWIERHALKLGLAQSIASSSKQRIEMDIRGPLALIEAMEVACYLGPIEIWVDDIQICLPQTGSDGIALRQ